MNVGKCWGRRTVGLPPFDFAVRMIELNDFYNEGFGWICQHCERELAAPASVSPSRLLSEGEGEIRMSSSALAKWADPEQRTLVCPRCGITELADRS